MRSDISSSPPAPELPAACSTNSRRFPRTTTMRLSISASSDRMSGIGHLLARAPYGLPVSAQPRAAGERSPEGAAAKSGTPLAGAAESGVKAWRAFMAKYLPEGDATDSNHVYAYGVIVDLAAGVAALRRRCLARERDAPRDRLAVFGTP